MYIYIYISVLPHNAHLTLTNVLTDSRRLLTGAYGSAAGVLVTPPSLKCRWYLQRRHISNALAAGVLVTPPPLRC